MISTRLKSGRSQRGIAAVELALLLPIFLLLLTVPLFFGRVFWHYSVVQRAAQDAARYLSSVPHAEMRSPTRVGAVVEVAQAIVAEEIAELNPGGVTPVVTPLCDGITCAGIAMPQTVTVAIQVQMDDLFFTDMTGLSIPLTAVITFPYLGQ